MCRSAVPKLMFTGNCTVMASIWSTLVSPTSTLTAGMSWLHELSASKEWPDNFSIYYIINKTFVLISLLVHYHSVEHHCHHRRRHQCWKFSCNRPQTIWMIIWKFFRMIEITFQVSGFSDLTFIELYYYYIISHSLTFCKLVN
jgi:hypothetical protein